jgi:hypothetical protein
MNGLFLIIIAAHVQFDAMKPRFIIIRKQFKFGHSSYSYLKEFFLVYYFQKPTVIKKKKAKKISEINT